jgi:hypothetical protein
MTFPTTFVEHLEISRLMVGTNWFLGYSHQSAAKSRWIKEYMDLDRIVEVMCVFAREGINSVMGPLTPALQEAIRRVEAETGVHMIWACTPSGEHIDDLLPNIEKAAEMGAEICMPHQHWTDGNLVANEKRLIGLEKATERIRALGMIPGLSTHRPETIRVCDDAGYDVATYIQIYNPIGFLCQVETDWIAKVINGTTKPVMCIKPLAAGRVLPTTGLSFVYHSIKPTDIVCIGTMSTYEAEDDIRIAREILSSQRLPERELDYSRSKQGLV